MGQRASSMGLRPKSPQKSSDHFAFLFQVPEKLVPHCLTDKTPLLKYKKRLGVRP